MPIIRVGMQLHKVSHSHTLFAFAGQATPPRDYYATCIYIVSPIAHDYAAIKNVYMPVQGIYK